METRHRGQVTVAQDAQTHALSTQPTRTFVGPFDVVEVLGKSPGLGSVGRPLSRLVTVVSILVFGGQECGHTL